GRAGPPGDALAQGPLHQDGDQVGRDPGEPGQPAPVNVRDERSGSTATRLTRDGAGAGPDR
ncbi:MAG: hypothetical protein EBQ56_16605, partial [Proteobacteria bacterium]|nr:hypothetical protein [Pseudomonadota bacterium]